MNDVIAGQVDFLSGDFGTLLPMVKAGRLKALAVTGPRRVETAPEVPTVAESGLPGFEASGWFGIFAPKGTPTEVIQKIEQDIAQVLKDPRVKNKFAQLGGSVMPLSASQLSEYVTKETAKWKQVIVDNKVTADALE